MADFIPIQIPAMRTSGMPIPSPTPRPTLMVSVLYMAPEDDAGAVDEVF